MKRTAVAVSLTIAALAACATPKTAAPVATAPVAAAPAPIAGGVYGDPTLASLYWHQQRGSDCALAASQIVIREITNRKVTEAQVVRYAKHRGWYSGDGTSWAIEPALFAHYGVKAELGTYTLAELTAALGRGERVVALVNAEQLWNSLPKRITSEYGWGSDLTSADHAVVVDSVDTIRGTVMLSDTGPTWGRAEVVPLSVFLSSWATGGNSLAVAASK